MKKWLIIVLISISVVSTTVVFANVSGVFETVNYNIKIGNAVVELQYPIYINDNRAYVSLRSICDELGIPIHWDEENREVKMDIYNKKIQVSEKTPFKEEGVIPDAETALIVGKVILEKYAEKPMEYETEDKIYFLEVEFLEQYNAWRICQTFKYKNGGGWSATGQSPPNISISKNTGEVLYLNTSTFFKD